MNLNINNFGPINKAKIELNKLNVIAGVNGSGKTTSSKLLYCFLTSNSNEKDYLANITIDERFKTLITSLYYDVEFDSETLNKLKKLIDAFPRLTDKIYNDKLKNCINSLKIIINESQINNKDVYLEKLNTVETALEVNSIEHRKFFEVSNVLLNSEFRYKDLKLKGYDVQLNGKENDCEFSYKLDLYDSKLGFIIENGDLACPNIKNIIYIDSPSIFNSIGLRETLILEKQPYHLRFLSRLLNTPKNIEDVHDSLFYQKLDEYNDEITEMLGGFIYYDDEEREFLFKTDNDEYSMKNTSSGVKQLGIIQMLLSNRTLTENSFLIMDEPEVNLHPEWQVKFAKIIILMIKDLNISIFINSHSPQFIEALEVYSAKYGLSNETKFYLSEQVSETKKYNFKEIKRRNLTKLYNNLGDPYDKIDEIRIENAFKGIE